MASLIGDDMLRAFSVVGSPREVGRGYVAELGGVYDRATIYSPYEADPALWPVLLDAAR